MIERTSKRAEKFARESELCESCPGRLANRFDSKQALLYRFDTSTTKLLVGRAARRLFDCLLFNDK